MNISDKSMAAILLCTYIGLNENSDIKPLTPGEWEKLEDKLKNNSIQIDQVIEDSSLLKKCGYDDSEISRFETLKNRGVNVALELDKYAIKGIKVVTVFDNEYPLLLRRKLLLKSPAVLFYAGNIELGSKFAIGMVGSRNVDADVIEFSKSLVEKAVSEKMVIISGGAKGVDSIAEQTALASGGYVVEYLADSLESKIKRPEIIKAILNGHMLLFTDTKPNLGFTVPKAMNRNKYIYASSNGTFVVCSDYNKGGTWTGACEALNKEYCKVFVWDNPNYDGNQKLIVEKSGIPFALNNTALLDVLSDENEASDGEGVSEDSNDKCVQLTIEDFLNGE